MRQGAHIIDIGIDTSRRGSRSPYYALEQREISRARYAVESKPWPPSPVTYTPHDFGPCP